MDVRAVLESRLGRSLAWESIEERRIAHYHQLFEAQDLLPGVRELMEEGRRLGLGLGVASNSTVGWVSRGLTRFGLSGQVGALRGRDTARRPKPHPDPYLEVLAELGADASASFAFEDSATGVASARAAGLHVVAVPNALTRRHDLSAAHQRLSSLADFDLNAALEAR
jgi:HAD superfamily hydrolase (TIGR01509 family)